MSANNKVVQNWVNALIIPWSFSVISLTFLAVLPIWLALIFPFISLFMLFPIITLGGYYLKNGYLLLDHIAAEKPGIPVFGYDFPSMFRDWRHIGQFVVVAIIIQLGNLINQHIYDGLGDFYWFISLLFFPASIAAMSQENKVFSALNPVKIIELIKYWGKNYPIILIGVFFQVAIVWFLWGSSSLLLINILISLSIFNSLLVWIGYNTQAIEYVKVEKNLTETKSEFEITDRKVRWIIDEIYQSSNISNFENATLAVEKLLNEYGESDKIFTALIKETYPWKQKKIYQFIIERYCLFLIKNEQSKESWSVFIASQKKLDQYSPENPLLLKYFATIAYNFKDFKSLFNFVNTFIEKDSYKNESRVWLIKLLELGYEKQEKDKCLNIYKMYCNKNTNWKTDDKIQTIIKLF